MTSENQVCARVIDHGVWDIEVRSAGTICQINNKGELFPDASGRSGRSQNTMLEHARLIAEAFNTQSECGLSPRELLEGYRELREALSLFHLDSPNMTLADLRVSGAALAKHKEV